MKNKVQLIQFFDIYKAIKLMKSCPIDADTLQQLDRISLASTVAGGGRRRRGEEVSMEQEVQTELHPLPFHKDETYVWNLWDLRRKAIELANLRRKKTSSSQTALSYHRLEIASQRHEHREKNLQTNDNKEVNTE